jgi:hypothetical protein
MSVVAPGWQCDGALGAPHDAPTHLTSHCQTIPTAVGRRSNLRHIASSTEVNPLDPPVLGDLKQTGRHTQTPGRVASPLGTPCHWLTRELLHRTSESATMEETVSG